MFCTRCHKEFDKDILSCPDCGIDLIENQENGIDIIEAMKPVKVTSVTSAVEADLIINLLRNNGIPCFKKDNGAGSYMNIVYGFSVFGQEIYVDESDYQKASQIVQELSAEQASDGSSEEQDNVKEDTNEDEYDSYKNYPFYKNPRTLVRIYFIGTIFVGILVYILNKVINS